MDLECGEVIMYIPEWLVNITCLRRERLEISGSSRFLAEFFVGFMLNLGRFMSEIKHTIKLHSGNEHLGFSLRPCPTSHVALLRSRSWISGLSGTSWVSLWTAQLTACIHKSGQAANNLPTALSTTLLTVSAAYPQPPLADYSYPPRPILCL